MKVYNTQNKKIKYKNTKTKVQKGRVQGVLVGTQVQQEVPQLVLRNFLRPVLFSGAAGHVLAPALPQTPVWAQVLVLAAGGGHGQRSVGCSYSSRGLLWPGTPHLCLQTCGWSDAGAACHSGGLWTQTLPRPGAALTSALVFAPASGS